MLLESAEMSEMRETETKTSENKLAPLSQELRMCKDVFALFNPLTYQLGETYPLVLKRI